MVLLEGSWDLETKVIKTVTILNITYNLERTFKDTLSK